MMNRISLNIFLSVFLVCVKLLSASVNDTKVPVCTGEYILDESDSKLYCLKDASGVRREASEVSPDL